MLVMLALGVMDVAVMVGVTLAISAERLGPWPRATSRALGVAAIVAGSIALAFAP
jgi:predicted metal-binding membrane protein